MECPSSIHRNIIEEKIKFKLEESILACDLLLTLFSAALYSYRRATICKPFPENFKCGKECNFEEAQLCLDSLPCMKEIATQPDILSKLPMKSLILLHIIIEPIHFTLKELNHEEYYRTNKFYNRNPSSQPSHIFEIVYKDYYSKSKKFNELQEQFKSKTYAFHGTALENIYSILQGGLTLKFSKATSLFGDGIYLTLDNLVAENFFSLGSSGWKKSMFSNKLGCIFGCEVVDNNPSVKYVGADQKNTPLFSSANNTVNKKNYLVVENEECVKVKHLLMFEIRTGTNSTNKCIYMLGLYLLLLFFVASFRS